MKIHGSEFLKLAEKEGFVQVVKWFLRYVLISASTYTSSKNGLAYIGVYTFISVYQSLKKVNENVYVGDVIDSMLETVGEDIQQHPEKAEDLLQGQLLGGDNSWLIVIDALNELDNFHRQIVSLYNIEMLSTGQISALTRLSIEQVRIELEAGERQVEKYLKHTGLEFDSAAEQINIVGRMLDMDLISTVADSIGEYIEEM